MAHLAIHPGRVNAIAVAIAILAALAFQPSTPAQAAALWMHSQHAPNTQVSKSSSQPTNDPAYEPPPKHGTNYVAPTAEIGTSKTAPGTEKLNLRTQNSRTYTGTGRQLSTLVYPESVNYLDASGTWQVIDNSLVKTTLAHYAYQNKANRYTVYLPADIGSEPIRIAIGSSWLTFSLQGAKGAASISGSTATFRNALPGVTVIVRAQADSVEESFVLEGPSSLSKFTYQLQMSSGLKLKSVGNGFTVVDTSGRTVFGIAAPAMFDIAKNGGTHSSAIVVSTTTTTNGTNLTFTADGTWLRSSGRKWPVTIDPTFIVGDIRDCYLSAGSPTTSFCGGTSLNAGFDGTNASRALLQFSLSAIPATDTVLSAKLLMYLGSATTSNATSLAVYSLTRAWTSGATWNTYDGTNAWSAAGGDFNATAAATTNGIATTGSYYSWTPTSLVQGWLNGSIANDGLIVKEPTESTTNVLSFNSATGSNPPYLQVVHQQGGSTRGSYSTTVQADSPVAYWHLDETSGSTMNDAENVDSGTYQGGYTLGQTPLIQPAAGNAVSFNGSTGYATAPGLTTLQGDNTRSIELWFQTSSASAQYLVDAGAGWYNPNQQFSLIVTPQGWITNNPPAGVSTPGLYLAFDTQAIYWPGLYLEDGKRHHVVLEVSGANIWLYVDGNAPGAYFTNQGGNDGFNSSWSTRYLQQQPITLTTTPNTGANPILLGWGRYNSGSSLNGNIDEVAVYSTALSATQVQNHWQAGNGLPWSPTNVSATAGTNQATVSWTAPTFNGSGITGYVVTPQVGSNLRTPVTFSSTATSQTLSNLSGGTSYSFSVTPFNSLGLGVTSASSSAVSPSGAALALYEDTVLADSPVGFWPLGETSFNTATDLTQTANGQFFNSYSLGDTGPVINYPNKAANLSGSYAYVRLNHTALLEPAALTVEAWVKPSSVPTNDTPIFISPQSGTAEWSTNGYVLMYGGNNGGAPGKLTWEGITSATLQLGVWSHVVAVQDSTATRIYINGKQSVAVGGGTPNYGGSPNFDAQLTRYSFPGDVADVAIYSSALSASQVAAHYAAAGYGPGPVSNVVATASTNSASLTWTAPSYVGPNPITSYTVTPVVDGKASTPINISGNGTGANIPNLPGGASYTFQVQANNANAAGVVVTSSAATITSPTVGPGGFGIYLYLRGSPLNGQAYSHYGLASRNNAPALSTWTIEGRIWGIQVSSATGSHMLFGYLGGTTSNPSDQNGVAGLYFDLSAAPKPTARFIWPGGSCVVSSSNFGIPFALGGSTPAHVALTYDGTTVRGFINGTIADDGGTPAVPCVVTTSNAQLPAAPFGFMDNAGLVQGTFDEFRVSSVARWTGNFTVPGSQYAPPYDGFTSILWHFNDYQISKLPSTHIIDNQTDGTGYPVTIIPSTYRDSITTNHANTVWQTGPSAGHNDDDWRRPYSLGQGVTADELTGGESKWLCPCTISSTARPVNDATGEFYHTFTDFHIPGRIDLDLNHTYSSLRATTVGPLGYGWTDNYNEFISFSLPSGGGDATVHESNGSAVLFTLNGGIYAGPPSEHITLQKNGSQYVLIDAGQNREVFLAPNGNNISWLSQLIDRHNSAQYTLTLAYSSGNLTTVTDPAGRTLTFTYGTITGFRTVTVTDSGSPARSVIFQVGNDPGQPATYNNLTQVTDVAGGLTKFTYVNYSGGQYLQTMTDPNNGVTTNTYDPTSHMITSQQDPITTRTTTFSYSGGITTITDPKTNVTQEEYLNGILMSRTIGYGTAQAATWTFSFDPAAVGLTASVGPNGETTTTVRDANANVLSETDGLGRTTTYTYNSFSEPLTIQDPTLVTTTNTYSASGDLATTSRPLVGTQQVQTTTYNHADSSHQGDVTSMVDADNFTWTYGYDSNGYRNSVVDPLSNKTTYVFNADGWMTLSTSPNGYQTRQDTFVRTPTSGSWGTATDGNPWTLQSGSATYSTTGTQGKIATSSSDSWESLGSALANDGGEVLVRWQVGNSSDKAGAILRVSTGAVTFYGVRFNGAGNVELFGKWGGTIHTNIGGVQIAYSPGTAKQWFRFRVAGSTLFFKVWADGSQEPANWSGQTTDTNVTGTGFAGLYGNASRKSSGVLFDQFSANPYATTTYTYNSFGQRTGLTDPENHTTVWHYDPNQNLDRVTDADNNLTTNVYDADNELTQVKRADSPQTTLTTDYNPDGTVADQKDGKNNAIQAYAYDSLAHVTTVTDALNNVTTYVYDAYGNMLSKQDPGGNCAAQTPTGCTTYVYDAGNQLTAISYSDGVTPNVSGITYDGDGQRLGMSDGTGSSSWGWDSLHRMVSYTNGNGAQVQWVYNLRNLATTITYPGSLSVTRGYDNAGRWTSVRDWNSNTTSFGYDADSNLTTETFPATSSVVDTFTFNAADQMTNVASVKGGSTTLFTAGYTRDSANQLTSDSSAASGTGSYKYTALNQLCYASSSNTSACSPPNGTIPYAYDAADNLTQKGSTQQVFNNADELCWTFTTSGSCGSPPSGSTTYQYDTRGNRTNVSPSGGQAQTLTYDQANRLTKFAVATTTSYGYNGDGLRMCKYPGSSTAPCQATGNTPYVWDAAGSLPLLLKDGTTAYVYGPSGLPIEQVNTSATYWFHHDQIGSTRLITDSTGTSQATYSYDPYGGLALSTGSITNPFRFNGQYQDSESGDYYLRARYYDPSTAQLLCIDPAVERTRLPFGYGSDNPLNVVDPSGQDGWGILQNVLVQVGHALPTPARTAYVGGLTQAGNFLGAFQQGNTQGVCFDVSFNVIVWGGFGQVCAVVSYDANGNPKGFGTTESWGTGPGAGLGAGGMLSYQRSNAQNISDLGGGFVYTNACVGDVVGVGGGGSSGISRGKVVAVGEIGVGPGGGAYGGVGVSNTATQTWFGS